MLSNIPPVDFKNVIAVMIPNKPKEHVQFYFIIFKYILANVAKDEYSRDKW